MTRLTIVLIAVVVLVGALLAATGVLYVQNSNDKTGITIDKKELKEKTDEAVKKTEEAGSKALDKAGQAMHNAADAMRGSSHDSTRPATTPRRTDKSLPDPEGSRPLPEFPRP
jgi:uncharacterized membrane protein